MKTKGLTLIELLVVIVIIGILATIGISNFSNYYSKAYQGKSYALQAQIGTIISADCIVKGYACKENLVPNWAFSEGDTGDWAFDSTSNGAYFEISEYRLYHAPRPGFTSPDYIHVPLYEPLDSNKIYRVDVVGRDIQRNSANLFGPGFIGFSTVGSGIGGHVRINQEENGHMCDVFKPASDGAPIRLFVSARADATFDEVSIREVVGYSDVNANNDCNLEEGGVTQS